MRAMQLEKIASIDTAPLRIVERADPEPGPGQVRVAVTRCAVCRTDLHVIEGDLPEHRLPIVPGHQIVGVVDGVGAGCRRLAMGQRVGVAWLGRTCGACRFCAAQRENLCESARFTGYHEDGGYATHVLAYEDFAYVLPEAFTDTAAAPLLCAGIIGYRALQRAEVPRGGTVALFGFGSSAHLTMQLARRRGCGVYVVTRGHQDMAEQLGADWAGQDWRQMPGRPQSAIVFAPVGHLIAAVLESLDKGGTVSLAGIHMTATPPLEYEKHLFYERQIRSVTANTRQDGVALLEEAARAQVEPVTSEYSLADANRALQDLKTNRVEGTAVLVVGDG